MGPRPRFVSAIEGEWIGFSRCSLALSSGSEAFPAPFCDNPISTSQPRPLFRDHDRVPRILRIVLHRRMQAHPAGMQIDEMPQLRDVLRGLVGHAGHVI